MNDRFPVAAILITAAAFAGFAVWLGVNPNALLETFGIEDRTPQMTTEIRAFYGGIEMAIAIVMVVLWRRGDLFAALLIGGVPLLCSASGRCIGFLVDGFAMMHAALAGLEFVGAGICLTCASLISRSTDDDSS